MKEDKIEFRVLHGHELEEGYQILCDATDWLRSHNINMWTNTISKNTYSQWHSRGYNLGLFRKDQLCFVISAMPLIHPSWRIPLGDRLLTWLRLAAVANDHRGNETGKIGFQYLFKYFKEQEANILYGEYMANNQFLNEYYRNLGFEVITTKEVRHINGMHIMALVQRCLS